MPNATSRWWEHYWTRCRIEPQHISCTLTGFFRITFYWGWILGCFGLWWRITLEGPSIATGGNVKSRSLILFKSFHWLHISGDFHGELDPKVHTCRQTENTGVGVVSKSAVEKKLFWQFMGSYKHNPPLKGEQKENLGRRNAQTPTPSKHRVTEKKRKEITGILSKKLAHCEQSQLFKWKK